MSLRRTVLPSSTDALVPVVRPADHGFLTWSLDPALSVGSTGPTAGVQNLIKVRLPAAATINSIVVYLAAAGVTLNNCYVALLDSTGTRVAVSADQSTAWQSGGAKTVALTAPYSAAAGVYYVDLLVGNGSTTPPTFARGTSIAIANIGLTAPGLRFSTVGSGLTAIPTSVDLSTAVSIAFGYWVALKA